MQPDQTEWQRHTHRGELISFVLKFVQSVRGSAGIREVALIGSLCTPKQYPKDADLLVMIEDAASLAELAKCARRLQGQAMSIGHGSDVFLVNPAGEYLGRVCPWKECRPGLRMSCDALHCGRRAFLHDDLHTIRLARTVTAAHALRLWPHLQARGDIPADIMDQLVMPLQET
jgi:hypothetical protein